MTVLVTGGAGFIGSELVRQLVEQGANAVCCFDKLTYAGNLDSLDAVSNSDRFSFIRGDVCNPDQVEQALNATECDTVYHLAAESHVDRSIDNPTEFAVTNVLGTLNLLQTVRTYWKRLGEEKRQRFRFIHVSTDEVYGALGPEGEFTEETPFAPNSPYSASKAAADHFARSFFITYGMPVLITNCSNNYGAYQFPEKLVPLMINRAIENQPLPVYGDGLQIRDWLHVSDHCQALQLVAAEGDPGQTYNIGGECERTNLAIVEQICAEMDSQLGRPVGSSKQLIEFVDDRPGHDRRYAVDISKIRRELGWSPTRDFETGFRETIA